MNNQAETIKIVKFLIAAQKQTDKKLDFTVGQKLADYLLGQFIRRVWLPKKNYYVSVTALEKWIELGQEPSKIWDTFYKDKVKNKSGNLVVVSKYKGAEKEPKENNDIELKTNECFCYREVFHDDHIVTVQSIKDQLYDLKVADDDSIINVLQSIKVAKIMKAEDRAIERYKKGLLQDVSDQQINTGLQGVSDQQINTGLQSVSDQQIKEYYSAQSVTLLNYKECAKKYK